MDFSRRWWYLVAVLIPLMTWLLATAQLAGRWDVVRGVTVEPVGGTISAANRSVALFTDLPQPDREISCEAIGPGKESTDFRPPPVEVQVTSDGTRWHLVGLLDAGTDDMRIRCTPEDERSDAAAYGYAIVADLDTRMISAHLIGWSGILLGVTLAGFVTYTRYRKVTAHE